MLVSTCIVMWSSASGARSASINAPACAPGSRQIGVGQQHREFIRADARQRRSPGRTDSDNRFAMRYNSSSLTVRPRVTVISRECSNASKTSPSFCAPTIPPAGAGLVEGCGRQCSAHSKPVGQPGRLVGHHLMVAFSQCADIAECHREPCGDRGQAQRGQRHRQAFAASQKSHAKCDYRARHRQEQRRPSNVRSRPRVRLRHQAAAAISRNAPDQHASSKVPSKYEPCTAWNRSDCVCGGEQCEPSCK